MKEVIFEDLGIIPYKQAWDYQKQVFEQLIDDKKNNPGRKKQYLLFCQHNHVFTLGKSGKVQNLLIPEQLCKNRGIEYFAIERGGDITYHGPQQLVAYPIIDLEAFDCGIKNYISQLEDVVIRVLNQYGIQGEKDEKAMGVWMDAANPAKARKICAIGVKSSRFVTMHGFALNVNTDLSYYNFINPCGFVDRGVTSMEKELGRKVDFAEVSEITKQAFTDIFGMQFTR